VLELSRHAAGKVDAKLAHHIDDRGWTWTWKRLGNDWVKPGEARTCENRLFKQLGG
jgi:hypothetical protein